MLVKKVVKKIVKKVVTKLVPLDQNKLIIKTTNYMKKNNLKILQGSPYDINSCWTKIAYSYFNLKEEIHKIKLIALRIKTRWDKNK